jgi:hypothetical protein
MLRLLEMASSLSQGDSVQQAIAGNYYERVRKYCRENPNDVEIAGLLPRGYQLIQSQEASRG